MFLLSSVSWYMCWQNLVCLSNSVSKSNFILWLSFDFMINKWTNTIHRAVVLWRMSLNIYINFILLFIYLPVWDQISLLCINCLHIYLVWDSALLLSKCEIWDVVRSDEPNFKINKFLSRYRITGLLIAC